MATSTRSPIDDLTFDVITVLHEKAKALEAYDQYLRDAEEDAELHELLTRIRQSDEEHVRALKEALARRLDEELGWDEEYEDEEYDEDAEESAEEEEDAAARAAARRVGPQAPLTQKESGASSR